MAAKLQVNVISESEFTVQGHGVHTAYLEMVNALRKRDDIEVMTNSKKPSDIVHIHTIGPFALRFLMRSSAKKVVSAHMVPGSLIGSIKFAKLWSPLGTRYLKFFYSRADLVLAVSDDVKRELLELGVTSPIEVMYNSIDTGRYKTTKQDKLSARQDLSIEEDKFVVMCSGQVQPRKRFETFLELARQLPSVEFIWVGGVPFKHLGDHYAQIQKQIAERPENLAVTGVLKFEDVGIYYQAADVFLLPSLQETFGLVVVEAAASGLPVIVRNIPDYNHTFGDDVLRGTDENFAEIIQSLRTDKKLYEQYTEKSSHIAARFDSATSVSRLVKMYRNLV